MHVLGLRRRAELQREGVRAQLLPGRLRREVVEHWRTGWAGTANKTTWSSEVSFFAVMEDVWKMLSAGKNRDKS